MRKLLLASCAVLALSVGGFTSTVSAAQNAANNGGEITQKNSNNTISKTSSETTTKTNIVSSVGANSPVANNGSRIKNSGNTEMNTKTISGNTKVSIEGDLKNSVLGSGSLSQSTTNTRTVSLSNTTTASGGAGASFNTSNVAANRIKYEAAGYSGNVVMDHSMGGQGILQANQNTGANAVQQNSVALTSWVGNNGGGLSGFSPNTATR